jgi:hypothetical protein
MHRRRFVTVLGTFLIALVLGSGATLGWVLGWWDPKPTPVVAQETVTNTQSATMAEALRLVQKARRLLSDVKDYHCIYLREEAIDGEMGHVNEMRLRVRHAPFSVYMEWFGPPSKRNRKAAYVAGKNDGKMVVKMIVTLKLDPEESIRRKESRHTILEAGLKNMIERYAAAWEKEQALGLTEVTLQDLKLVVPVRDGGREREFTHDCTCVVTKHPVAHRARFVSFVSKVYFDKTSGLPVRAEVYDWPTAAHPDGQLVERYTYLDLVLNPGLKDAHFSW